MFIVVRVDVGDPHLFDACFWIHDSLDLIHQLFACDAPSDFSGRVNFCEEVPAFIGMLEVVITAGHEQVVIAQLLGAQEVSALQIQLLAQPGAFYFVIRPYAQELFPGGSGHPQGSIF